MSLRGKIGSVNAIEPKGRGVSLTETRHFTTIKHHFIYNRRTAMEQRVSIITLGVADLDRSRKFYRMAVW
jgi:hypothetical protein